MQLLIYSESDGSASLNIPDRHMTRMLLFNHINKCIQITAALLIRRRVECG